MILAILGDYMVKCIILIYIYYPYHRLTIEKGNFDILVLATFLQGGKLFKREGSQCWRGYYLNKFNKS